MTSADTSYGATTAALAPVSTPRPSTHRPSTHRLSTRRQAVSGAQIRLLAVLACLAFWTALAIWLG